MRPTPSMLLLFLLPFTLSFVACGGGPEAPVQLIPEKPVVVDRDQDGIPDAEDKCPDQAEDKDGDMDLDGCPEERQLVVVTIHQIKLNEKVFFDTGKTSVQQRSMPLIEEVAAVLKDNPNIHIRIEGHTDSRGSEDYNETLSQGRAESIRKLLAKRGIADGRLDAVGFGERRPIAENTTKEGRATNRRVEIHITKR